MSGEYDDVLTNQPVVIDNVSITEQTRQLRLSFWYLLNLMLRTYIGLGDYQGWLCRTGPS